MGAIVRNAGRVKRLVGGARVLAVVKADAYGHGVVPVARALAASKDVAALAVSLTEEGFELRHAGIGGEVLVMGGTYANAHKDVLAAGLTPIVSELADVEGFAQAASALGTRARVHVKVDTGMARLGVCAGAFPAFLEECGMFPEVDIAGFCTHLASADAESEEPTRRQLAAFDALVPLMREAAPGVVVHAANSAATLRFPEARYDAVRPGLALYGGASLDAGLEPAMALVTGIAQLREIERGETVSYGGLWTAPRRSRIATLPCGYADGYPRRLTGSGEVLVHGRRCPVVGAVCMDMTLVDVTDLGARAQIGDEAVLLGAQGDELITAAELAGKAGLIEYEITCGVSKRVPRIIAGSP